MDLKPESLARRHWGDRTTINSGCNRGDRPGARPSSSRLNIAPFVTPFAQLSLKIRYERNLDPRSGGNR
jgi:hypothetical protein